MTGRVGEDLPKERRPDLKRAIRLAWWTIAYLISTIALLAVVLGGSQALKTAWFDDLLAIIPPVLFLIGTYISPRLPSARFPFGFNRAVTAGYLGSSVALLGVGLWLLVESLLKLFEREHPIIGSVTLFGHVIWHGWLAIPPLLWSAVPAVFLGRAKLPLGTRLHDKVILADARMNEADWQTGAAAIAGIIGIALGWWWADSLAAILISFDIVRDGWASVMSAISDFMDRRPESLDGDEAESLPGKLQTLLCEQEWVVDAAVRLREDGRLFVGEALVVPREDNDLTARIAKVTQKATGIDWRLSEFTISPVPAIPEAMSRAAVDGRRRDTC